MIPATQSTEREEKKKEPNILTFKHKVNIISVLNFSSLAAFSFPSCFWDTGTAWRAGVAVEWQRQP